MDIARFSVNIKNFGSEKVYELVDNQKNERLSVLPFLGGSINDLVFIHKGKQINIIDGYASPDEAKNNLLTSFKGSKLFPFPNRIKDATYNYDGRSYKLFINFPNENNTIHGLVFDKEFEVSDIKESDESCCLKLSYSYDQDHEGYPFKFILSISYILDQDGFKFTSHIENKSSTHIPIGDGWHPYFKIGDKTVDELSIEFPSLYHIKCDRRGIPIGEKEKYREFNILKPLKNNTFDNCFELMPNKMAQSKIYDEKEGFGFVVWQNMGKKGYNYLQVFTPPKRNSIALEPMTCIPDSFNNQTGLIQMAPNESIRFNWGIKKIQKQHSESSQ